MRTRMHATESPRQLVTSSHRRLASVSFGRNTDRLSKRHEATAKTNLKCLLTKQSELAALRRPRERGREKEKERERTDASLRRLLLSMTIIFAAPPPTLPTTFRPRAVNHNGSPERVTCSPSVIVLLHKRAFRTSPLHFAPFLMNYIFASCSFTYEFIPTLEIYHYA